MLILKKSIMKKKNKHKKCLIIKELTRKKEKYESTMAIYRSNMFYCKFSNV